MSLARRPHEVLCHWLAAAFGRNLRAEDLPATDQEWRQVLRLAGSYLVAPLLPRLAREQAVWEHVPADARDYLETVHGLNLQRNRRCLEQLAHLAKQLNEVGVQPLILKGAAALVDDLYPTLGERIISDLDVLIPEDRLPDILKTLGAQGYCLMDGTPLPLTINRQAVGHHFPRIAHPDWAAGVELHIRPVANSARAGKVLAAEEMLRCSRALAWRGTRIRLPSVEDFVMHNLLHAYSGDYRQTKALSLRQLFEFSLAARVFGNQIDWPAVIRRFGETGKATDLRGYAAFAQSYFGVPPPEGVTLTPWDKIRPGYERTWLAATLRGLWPIRRRVRNLAANPAENLRKLATRSFYRRLWRDCYAAFRSGGAF